MKEFPGDANILCVAAQASLVLRRFDECNRQAEEAIRLFPKFANAHDVYGDLLLATGRAELAVSAYEKTLRLDPARPATLAKIDRARKLASENQARTAQPALTGSRAPRSRMAFESEIGDAERHVRDGSAEPGREDISRHPEKGSGSRRSGASLWPASR